MFKIDLNKEKIKFIDYLLFQYDFKNPVSVWILNLLKTEPYFLSKINFVSKMNSQRILILSTTTTNNLPILYCKNYFCIDDGKQIFHDIRLENGGMDIYIPLPRVDERMKRMLFLQEVVGFTYNSLEGEEDFIRPSLSMHEWRVLLNKEIDIALDNKNQKRFQEISELLKFMDELEAE